MVSSTNREQENENNYDDLLVSIEANDNQLNLLIAVCDNIQFRDEIIQRYEQELNLDIARYRIELPSEQPSLSSSINQLIQERPELKARKNAVITVTGTEKFRFLSQHGPNQQSPQEKLLGYFQWTREAFKHFPYSIVLWVTTSLQQQIEQKSPDFWSWRKGVFRFESHAKNVVDITNIKPHLDLFTSEVYRDISSLLPLEDLQELIAKIEQKENAKTPQLANLYSDLGGVYLSRSREGTSVDYQKEQNLAIDYFQKAIKLQEELNLEIELADSLNNLAELYQSQEKYQQAELLCRQALELTKKLLGEEHPDVAGSLNNLALLYKLQKKYQQAEDSYFQALELTKKLLGEEHPSVAASLNNLALLYKSQGKYQRAELLCFQALELREKLLGKEHPDVASSLNNLALLYKSQGKYQDAEFLCLQALKLRVKLLGEKHLDVAISFNNLAGLYLSQKKYKKTEFYFIKALELAQKTLGKNNSYRKVFLNNFKYFLQEVINSNRVSELSNHPLTQSLLKELKSS
ncbi:MAG: tetratricopeptide repeat protein [Xenococcaceae cyanobacterium MO_167.B52]|nr:tetratricopeptide repeat protein [Xenococcaceae cyanobacterium MO_167.B52]